MSDLATFTCPRCEQTSAHPTDVEQRYCGACKTFWRVETCPGCGDEMWISEDPETEQRLERERQAFGDVPEAELVAVCDDCWEAMRKAFPTLDARLKLEGL